MFLISGDMSAEDNLVRLEVGNVVDAEVLIDDADVDGINALLLVVKPVKSDHF